MPQYPDLLCSRRTGRRTLKLSITHRPKGPLLTTQVVTARDQVRGVALPRAAILQFGLAIGLVLLPLLLAPLPPLTDYPNHLARLGILRDVLSGGPASPWYELSSLAVPNLLSDVVILLLAQLVSLEQAARIVLGLALLLPLLGVAALQR